MPVSDQCGPALSQMSQDVGAPKARGHADRPSHAAYTRYAGCNSTAIYVSTSASKAPLVEPAAAAAKATTAAAAAADVAE